MPYYSELGIYTPSSSYTNSLVKGPYSNHSSIVASNILPPSVKHFTRNNFRGFRPHLTTISESSSISPLKRISSPKLTYHSSPRGVKIPRPVKINTADIDVSLNKYKKSYDPLPKSPLSTSPTISPTISRVSSPKTVAPKPKEPSKKESVEATPSTNINRNRNSIRLQTVYQENGEKNTKTELSKSAEPSAVDTTPSAAIKRNRRSIRLQTVYKDTVDNEIKDIKSWRDNFKSDELVTEGKVRKKTPGEILKEKFLIRSKSKENIPSSSNNTPQVILRKPSTKKSSSFKDICHEISSDQFIEDLNPGQPIEVRRRQSRQYSEKLLNEIKRSSSTLSVEDVELLDALINAKSDVLLSPDESLNKHEKGRKKKVTRKRSSDKLTIDDEIKTDLNKSSSSEDISQILSEDQQPVKRKPTNKRVRKSSSEISIPETGTSRLRKDSSLTNMVKDISQVEIEMIATKPKPLITSSVGEIEEKLKPNLKAVIEDVEVEESPKPVPKVEKKFRFNVKVEELAVKKKIYAEKLKIDDNSKGMVQLPNPKKPIITSILEKNISKQVFKELGEPEIFKKKTKIVKSKSEVTANVSENKLQKSESGGNINYTITTAINKTKNNESCVNGTKKLKIMLVEKNESNNQNQNKQEVKEEIVTEDKPKLEDTFAEVSKNNSNQKEICLSNRSSSDREKELLKIVPINNCEQTSTAEQKIESIEKAKDVVEKGETSAQTPEKVLEQDVLKTKGESTPKAKLSSKSKKKKFNKITKNQNQQNEENSAQLGQKDENDNTIDIWGSQESEDGPPKLGKLKLAQKDPKEILKEIQSGHKELLESEEVKEATRKKMMSKRSLIQKATKDDPDLEVFEPPEVPEVIKEPTPEPAPSWAPLQSNSLTHWMHPWKKPQQNEEQLDIYAKPKFIRMRHIPRRWRKDNEVTTSEEDSEDSEDSESSEESSSESEKEASEVEEGRPEESNKVGASTSSNDSGFDSGRANKDKDCDVNCHKKCEKLTANLCGVNQKLVVEAIESVKTRKSSIDNRESPGLNPAQNPAFALDSFDLPEEVSQSSTYQNFQRSGRITPPATTIPRFRKYCVDDFNFLKVLGKGSFGKVLLAELKGTEYYYAVKCLKKDVVLEDDDVECTLIERKVLALGTKHPYLCHLLCTFQTESHLFFVMEYLNGGDLMFHIQMERRFSEARAKFYGAEIVSGLRFLHNKGIVYRDLKLDNILLDFDGHVRIADFGMCKLQIFLDRMADTFCGTPDYMAPEIIKGQHYNQCVDWWSFGVLLYEMLLGQSPFSGCDEDELFWSICNEKPVIPRFLSAEASSALVQFLDKDANRRLGNRFSVYGDIQDHPFFKPIDWVALEARQLEPPFKPNLQHPLDTQYFDKTFTTERAKLTPIGNPILTSIDQTQFQGFSYTNPNATDK